MGAQSRQMTLSCAGSGFVCMDMGRMGRRVGVWRPLFFVLAVPDHRSHD